MGYAPRRTLVPATAVDIVAAAASAPNLAKLVEAAQRSSKLLTALIVHLPPNIRSLVQAGPLDDTTWCLIAANNAVAAKLRQVLPTLLQAAQQRDVAIAQIRVKVSSQRLI